MLGATLALATINIIESQDLCNRANNLQVIMRNHMQSIAQHTGALTNIRGIGALVAADIVLPGNNSRLGYTLYQEAVKLGALLRPLGNTIYWIPPLTISDKTLQDLKDITLQALINLT